MGTERSKGGGGGGGGGGSLTRPLGMCLFLKVKKVRCLIFTSRPFQPMADLPRVDG